MVIIVGDVTGLEEMTIDLRSIACVAGAWKQWAQEKPGAREGDTRVSLARARSLFHPLLPSACYAGYTKSF